MVSLDHCYGNAPGKGLPVIIHGAQLVVWRVLVPGGFYHMLNDHGAYRRVLFTNGVNGRFVITDIIYLLLIFCVILVGFEPIGDCYTVGFADGNDGGILHCNLCTAVAGDTVQVHYV